jgi:hypothetical protein
MVRYRLKDICNFIEQARRPVDETAISGANPQP